MRLIDADKAICKSRLDAFPSFGRGMADITDLSDFLEDCETVNPAIYGMEFRGILQEERKYNAPLTLDELREMDGEPVWISPGRKTGKIPARWMLASGYDTNRDVYLFAPPSHITQGYEGKSYGKTWLAYRRKPEHSEA